MREPEPDRRAAVRRRNLALLASASLLLLAAGSGGEFLRIALRYEREAVLGGELWRLVTAHIVHLGWAHLLLNLAGLGLLAVLFGGVYSPLAWMTIAGASAAAIDAGFLLLQPSLGWYVGLSGVLHGLFMAGALALAARRETEGYWLLAGLLAKLAYEGIAGPLPLTESAAGGPVVEQAHLYGALGGGLVALVVCARASAPRPR